MALLIWLALLIGFSRMLELTAPPPPELKPIEARIVELPPEAGLQGGPAPTAPAKAKPAVVEAAPVIHPHIALHSHLKAAPAAPSETGTAKTEAPPAESSGSAETPSEGTRSARRNGKRQRRRTRQRHGGCARDLRAHTYNPRRPARGRSERGRDCAFQSGL